MFMHPYTKEPLSFKSQEELLDFLSRLNPMIIKKIKKQYSKKFPNFEILEYGKNVEIRKIKNKR